MTDTKVPEGYRPVSTGRLVRGDAVLAVHPTIAPAGVHVEFSMEYATGQVVVSGSGNPMGSRYTKMTLGDDWELYEPVPVVPPVPPGADVMGALTLWSDGRARATKRGHGTQGPVVFAVTAGQEEGTTHSYETLAEKLGAPVVLFDPSRQEFDPWDGASFDGPGVRPILRRG